jgi:ankyrin repeat protein
MSSSRPPGGDAGPQRVLPGRPSLEQLRKQAKDLLRNARDGSESALARISAANEHRGTRIALADALLAVAREYGFASWPKLVRHVEEITGGGFVLQPLIRPVELTSGRMWTLPDESEVATDDVYAMFAAARDGDLASVRQLVSQTAALATVEYNYTPPIHFAVREGHRDIVEFLIARGADLGYRSYPFHESLLSFAEDRGHEDVADLLRSRLSQKFAIASGTQAIIEAAGKGDLAGVTRELTREPALARAGNDTGDTALHHAAQHGHLRVVEALLDAGADPDAVRGDGYRPVHCALMPNWFFQNVSPRETIANLLLSRGARYTIFLAALRHDAQFVRDSLARDGSLANFEDTCHHRVLSAAVRRGDIAMTRLLLEHGADPNLPEQGAPRGLSLWIAVNDRNREIVRLLLDRGADPNGYVDSSGTPMSQALSREDHELVAVLRQHGGRVPEFSEQERAMNLVKAGKLAEAEQLIRANLHWIHGDEAGWGDGVLAGPANEGRHDVIAMLLRLGARVPPVSKWAPYYYFKHEATAAFLLENGMDPNHMNWHRFTLLHHMAAEGEVRKAKLLLKHGADVDAIDDEYRSTPLGVAARRGQQKLVELLLEHGADPHAAGAPWAVPIEWAMKEGHQRIADMLRETAH